MDPFSAVMGAMLLLIIGIVVALGVFFWKTRNEEATKEMLRIITKVVVCGLLFFAGILVNIYV